MAIHALDENSPVKLADLQASLAPKNRGNSLDELHNEAVRHKLIAMPVRTTLEALRLRNRPLTCIAHLRRGHFVILADIKEETVSIVDPPSRSTLPISTFLSEWSGDTLLLSSEPIEDEGLVQNRVWWSIVRRKVFLASAGLIAVCAIAFAVRILLRWKRNFGNYHSHVALPWTLLLGSLAGCSRAPEAAHVQETTTTQRSPVVESISADAPSLTIEPEVFDFGKVQVNQPNLKARFTVTNNSDSVLQIEEIKTSCGCTVAVPEKTALQAGEAVRLEATVKALEIGNRVSTVRLYAMKSGAVAEAEASIKWQAGSLIGVFPAKVYLGEIVCGSTQQTTIQLRAPQEAPLSECVTSVTATPESIVAAVLDRTTDDWTIRLIVNPLHPEPLGRASVVVHCPLPYGDIRIPIEWKSIESVSLSPKGTFLGKVAPDQEWNVQFIAKSADAVIERVELTATESPVRLKTEVISANHVKCILSGKSPSESGVFALDSELLIRGKDTALATLRFSASGIVEKLSTEVSNR